jgi:diguanylate cyclase (GGDEF)-like protein/PAS domain S-box-containing protein
VTLSRDITDRKLAESHLQNRSAMLDALISCDWLLHSSASWHTVAEKVLEQLCLAARFNRATIFKHTKHQIKSTLHKDISSNAKNQDKSIKAEALYQWQGLGLPKVGQPLKAIDYNADGCERWLSILKQGNPVFNEPQELTLSEQRFLKKHHLQSVLIMPLFVSDELWGTLMVELFGSSMSTYSQELGAAMSISRSLSAAIQKQSSEKRLQQAKIAFDSATEGIMILDVNTKIIATNQGFTNITGFAEEEVLGYTPKILQTADHHVWEALKTEGKWRGEVANHRKGGEPYQEWLTLTVVKDNLGKVINYVGVFADITKIVQSQNQLHQLVNQDALTGLPNRRLLIELLDQSMKVAERKGYKIAVLFIDLDRFKTINDSLGHQMGDKLLYQVSRRIKQSIRTSDVVARLGGDEFMVIMDRLEEVEDPAIVAKKVIHALQVEFIIDGKEIFIGASVGISVFPDDSKDVDGLIKAADIAMYEVKNSGKNNFCFYSTELSENALERFTMETQLRRALERNQFEVYYQPQVCLISGKIIGAEALVRWHHPDLGIVSPAKFIPVAEDTGLIMQIGEWVIRQAALQATKWNKNGHDFKRVSVNVSGVQILRSNFADTVYGLIIETDCDPSILELEITESTVMQNTQFVIETFDRIKKMGVSLAIDDFGTGYSSLSNLKRLPLDKIKIDQSFVRDLPNDLDDAAIANAIYAMATSLGFGVIAEGVETEAQADFLRNMGCTEAQGYLYSKPLTAPEFDKLLLSNQRKQAARSQEASYDQ